MGAADSKLVISPGTVDEITTIKGRSAEELDPCLERLRNLHVALLVEPKKRKPDVSHARFVNNLTWPTEPLLKPPSGESSLTDILLQRNLPQSQSVDYGGLDASTTSQLLAAYQEWQHLTAARVSKNQEELAFKIDAVEAVAMKLLQRLNYSASVMKTSSAHLQEVQYLKMEVREMKRGLNIVLDNYEAVCKRVEAQGPQFLCATTRPTSRTTSLTKELILGGPLHPISRTSPVQETGHQ